MIDDPSLAELTHQIVEQGYDETTASNYAWMIGDTPFFDENGKLLVRDGAKIIARLEPVKMFGR